MLCCLSVVACFQFLTALCIVHGRVRPRCLRCQCCSHTRCVSGVAPPAPAGLTAGYARGPERRGNRGPSCPLGAALAALLPAVPAACLGARPGVHLRRELLLLLQPLLGSRVRRRRPLLGDVLHSDLHGDAPTPPWAAHSREGESVPLNIRS